MEMSAAPEPWWASDPEVAEMRRKALAEIEQSSRASEATGNVRSRGHQFGMGQIPSSPRSPVVCAGENWPMPATTSTARDCDTQTRSEPVASPDIPGPRSAACSVCPSSRFTAASVPSARVAR
jgi:hypothetical protein